MPGDDQIPETLPEHLVEVAEELRDLPVTGFRNEDRRSIHRDSLGQPMGHEVDREGARQREKERCSKARRVEEFAKSVPYSFAEAREEFPGITDQGQLLKMWAAMRWAMAEAMEESRPDISL